MSDDDYGDPWDLPGEKGKEISLQFTYEEPAHFADCTCKHGMEEHTFGECLIDGCPCEGGWEE